ncbi:type IV toxin-antitoxin system AbiEi family antitoxin domain-containing protein [Nocardioides lianchengensis]|uniref:Transcriptional regulator, AbiEi antitoxin, Type IV TA system n=1 Tax=Nocardioides lianchengensis TaxID=1045774 RepID=A0A1G6J293_9ACTN|nr:type IV toxin-antitoxin system AbiEi family antitoxin domain-containing protein [Nocardioides lianchengensis]NYG12876.1 hypothetical protein [Nocardioides lianchengensis]SDC12908.1 Transcriptional regulator, AbiEi antitoxin, Type IV TA system [Nocardioides lianchengensis]
MMIPKRDPDDPRNGPVILRQQLLKAGWNDRAIRRRIHSGQWTRIRNGAFIPTEQWKQLDDAGRHGLRARAVQQQAKTEVVLSHVSGLPEYDAPTWGLDLSEVHVTRPDGKAGRHEAGVQQHCGTVEKEDVVTRNGVQVMTATRLVLEVTTFGDAEASLVVANHLLHVEATTPEMLRARYESMTQWPKTLITDLVLRLADPRIETPGESRTFYLIFRQGLPRPQPQYVVTDAAGDFVARVDFAWPELGVWLEFDGQVKYEKLLKPGQRASDVVLQEKEREKAIRRATGWRCIRITWADLAHPELTAARIRAELFPDEVAA